MASGLGSIVTEAKKAVDLAESFGSAIPDTLVSSIKRVTKLFDDYECYVNRMASDPSKHIENIIQQTSSLDWEDFSKSTSSTHLERGMLTGNEEAQLLRMLVSMSGATRVLEIGMFTGCAALAMAEVIPSHGSVVTCDINPALEKFVRQMVDKSPHGRKIKIRIAPAMETLSALKEEGCQFDFVFIDADKANYKNYFKFLLDKNLLAAGGTICVDNTLLNGNAYLPPDERNPNDVGAHDIPEFNDILTADDRVYRVMLPLRDGITIIRRKVDTDSQS